MISMEELENFWILNLSKVVKLGKWRVSWESELWEWVVKGLCIDLRGIFLYIMVDWYNYFFFGYEELEFLSDESNENK